MLIFISFHVVYVESHVEHGAETAVAFMTSTAICYFRIYMVIMDDIVYVITFINCKSDIVYLSSVPQTHTIRMQNDERVVPGCSGELQPTNTSTMQRGRTESNNLP